MPAVELRIGMPKYNGGAFRVRQGRAAGVAARELAMLKRFWLKSALVLGALALGGLALTPSPASARVFVHVGVGPWWGGPYYYYPPPVVYAPPPYYYAPPPVVYAPPPAPTPLAPQAQTWYYCDNPKGYYPYVSNCASGWRQVPARPQ